MLTAENNRIQVQFDKIEEAEWEGHKGFFIYISATSLVDYDVENDFLYRIGSTIIDHGGKQYEALFSETVKPESDSSSVVFRQFYSPTLEDSIDTLAIDIYVKPTYYIRKVVFHDLKDDMSNVLVNDLFIQNVQVDNKEIQLDIFDVHHLNGLTVSLRQENEDIYPAYTRTTYDPENNRLTASYEFTKTIPESFTLTLNRLKLQDQFWHFTLTVPAN